MQRHIYTKPSNYNKVTQGNQLILGQWNGYPDKPSPRMAPATETKSTDGSEWSLFS